jgi:hypothetical protein
MFQAQAEPQKKKAVEANRWREFCVKYFTYRFETWKQAGWIHFDRSHLERKNCSKKAYGV